MFPWVYGFEWTPGHVIFTSVFLLATTIVAATVLFALFRSYMVFRKGQQGQVAWQSLFHDLPAADRACRHAMTGELRDRVCEQGFDCRHCSVHARLIEGLPAAPAARLYHRGHTWVEPAGDGTVLVGLDEIATRLLGPVEGVDAPPAGARLEANTPAFAIRKNGAVLKVLAPVDGEVVECAVGRQGWLVRVRPQAESSDSHLLQGEEAEAWFRRETERVQIAASACRGVPSLADGGVLVEDVSAVLPRNRWEAVCGEILLDI